MTFYSVARKFVKALSYIFFPVTVHGNTEDMPKDSAVVLCANHLSFLDAVFLAIIFKRQIHFVAKKKYAQMFILKHIFKAVGAFGIDTEKADFTALKNCFKTLREHKVLGIFPEGTRVINGKISNPMPGAILIAHKTHSPIFTVRIKPRKDVFKLFVKTDIYIGELISVEALGVTDGKQDQYKQASAQLMDRIYSLGEVCQ